MSHNTIDFGQWRSQDFDAFLSQHRYLHAHKPTRFIADGIYKRLPQDWLRYLSAKSDAQLNRLILGATQFDDDEKCPSLLERFFETARRLSYPLDVAEQQQQQPLEIPPSLSRGMRAKKLHEVARLAPFIDRLCVGGGGISTIVDIGSGLGYVDRLLASLGHRVIAFEADDARTVRAVKLLSKSKCVDGLTFHTLQIDDPISAAESISSTLQQNGVPDTESYAVIGLHCCGELTRRVCDIFARLPAARLLVCIGCCYHLVESGSAPLCRAESEAALNSHSLRLATQGSEALRFSESARFGADHHLRANFYRALLEVAADESGEVLRRRQRHASNPEFYRDFSLFTRAVAENYYLSDAEAIRRRLLQLYDEHYATLYPALRAYRALQAAVQRTLEAYIVWDRKRYLERSLGESAARVRAEVLFDAAVSPRNIALIVEKRK